MDILDLIFFVEPLFWLVKGIWQVILWLLQGIAIAMETVWGWFANPLRRWWQARRCLLSSDQPPLVRSHILRLPSRNRLERCVAAERLGQMGDRSAVPALLRSLEWHPKDGNYHEVVVLALWQLGDPRALPTLHRLSTGRHLRLMQLAREAIAALEPKSSLVRATQAPHEVAELPRTTLLRPTASESPHDPNTLLRPQ